MTLRLLALVLGITTLLSAATNPEVSLKPSPDWNAATAEQMAALPKDASIEYVDFSISPSLGGYAILSLSTSNEEMSKQFVDGTVEGYRSSIAKAGHQNIVVRPGSLGTLKGKWIISDGKLGDRMLGTATLFLFAEKKAVIISTCSFDKKISADSEIVKSYQSRIQLDASLKPGDMERESSALDNNLSYQIGKIVGRILVFALFVSVGLYVFRRVTSKKAPPTA